MMDREAPKAGCCIECGKLSRLLVCGQCDPGSPRDATSPWERGGDRRWNGRSLVAVPLADHQAGLQKE